MGLLFPELSSAHGHPHSLGPSPLSLTMVVVAHVAVVAFLATFVPAERIAEMTRPFTARLIELVPKVPPAPPVVEPPKPKPPPRAKATPVQPRILAVTTPAPAAAVEFVVQVQPPPPVAVPPAPIISASPSPPAPPAPIVPARFDAAYLNNPKPVYPAISRRLGEEGKVVLRVHVDADGRATEVAIKSSSGLARLDNAAHAAVAQWRFVPARRGETAIDAWVLVPIVFNLEG